MSVSLQLNFNQIKNLIAQLNFVEKEKLAEYLDDETLFAQWEKLKEEKKNIPLTMDDITKEVEVVRSKRYKT